MDIDQKTVDFIEELIDGAEPAPDEGLPHLTVDASGGQPPAIPDVGAVPAT